MADLAEANKEKGKMAAELAQAQTESKKVTDDLLHAQETNEKLRKQVEEQEQQNKELKEQVEGLQGQFEELKKLRKKPRTPQTFAENHKRTRTSTRQIAHKQQKTSLHRLKAKQTVQNTNSPNETQRNCKRQLHQHTTAQKTSKTSTNSRCGWEHVLHGPTVGA